MSAAATMATVTRKRFGSIAAVIGTFMPSLNVEVGDAVASPKNKCNSLSHKRQGLVAAAAACPLRMQSIG